jgi:hypothetical protein
MYPLLPILWLLEEAERVFLAHFYRWAGMEGCLPLIPQVPREVVVLADTVELESLLHQELREVAVVAVVVVVVAATVRVGQDL